MSRAFVREDEGHVPPGDYFLLPPPDDPGYDEAAARALLQAARDAHTETGEMATGYRWGEPRLREHVKRILREAEERPETEQDSRFIRVAQRYLSQSE